MQGQSRLKAKTGTLVIGIPDFLFYLIENPILLVIAAIDLHKKIE